MLKIKNATFFKSFSDYKKIPNSTYPEIAFIGRSNVGKSSLINNLCNRKISETSSTPGKTQLINFFLINDLFYFVDFPGYGYAKVSKSQQKNWPRLIEPYLEKRNQLKIVIFLLDIRRIPNDQDKILNNWMKGFDNIYILYILTKIDKLSKNEVQKQKIKIALELFIDQNDFISYSITKKIGRTELLKRIEEGIRR